MIAPLDDFLASVFAAGTQNSTAEAESDSSSGDEPLVLRSAALTLRSSNDDGVRQPRIQRRGEAGSSAERDPLISLLELAKKSSPLTDSEMEQARWLCGQLDLNVRVPHHKEAVKFWYPLHVACWWRHAKLVGLMLEARASPTVETGRGDTPLYLAAQRGDLDIVRQLRMKGAGCLPMDARRRLQDKNPDSVLSEPDHGIDLKYELAVACPNHLLRELPLPKMPTLRPHQAAVEEIYRNAFEWLSVEREFSRSLAGLYSHRYLFELERIVKVYNGDLERAYEANKARLLSRGLAIDDPGLQELVVFHGTQRSRLPAVCTEGLRCGQTSDNVNDPGYFGDSRRGVYVTANADYAMYYCADSTRRPSAPQPCHVCHAPGMTQSPPDHMAIIVLKCVLGKCNKLDQAADHRHRGRRPDDGFDSNESPRRLEYFLYAEEDGRCTLCCPTHVIHVCRRERFDTSRLREGLHEVYG